MHPKNPQNHKFIIPQTVLALRGPDSDVVINPSGRLFPFSPGFRRRSPPGFAGFRRGWPDFAAAALETNFAKIDCKT